MIVLNWDEGRGERGQGAGVRIEMKAGMGSWSIRAEVMVDIRDGMKVRLGLI